MSNPQLSALLIRLKPHLIAMGVMLLIVGAYFSPVVLDGKRISQHDIVMNRGMAKELNDHREKHGDEPLWTGAANAGMPSWTIQVWYKTNIAQGFQRTFSKIFVNPLSLLLTLMIGFYVLLISVGVRPWLALVGAIAFGFSTYFPISIGAGHTSKLYSTGYMAGAIGGVLMVLKGRTIPGFVVTTLFTALCIAGGHIQIIFYAALTILAAWIAYAIQAIRSGQLRPLMLRSVLLIAAGLIGLLPNFSRMYNLKEHTPLTMRGAPTELPAKEEDKSGLPWDYAMGPWSMGVGETPTLMFPFFSGGSSGEPMKESSALAQWSKQYGAGFQRIPTYFGKQSSTSPIYVGASVMALFVLAFFVLKGPDRWWVLGIAVFACMLAYGKYYEGLNKFLFYKIPPFNKFRTPPMALTIVCMVVPFLAMMGLNRWLYGGMSGEAKKKALKGAAMVIGAISLVVIIHGATADFAADRDQGLVQQVFGVERANDPQMQPVISSFLESLQSDRKSLYMNYSFRGIGLMAVMFGLLFISDRSGFKKEYIIAAAGALIAFDLIPIGQRYLNEDNFTDENLQEEFVMTPADQAVLQDTDPSYRVLNLGTKSGNPLSDGYTPYHHKSILGYSTTRTRVYDDFQTNAIQPALSVLRANRRAAASLLPEMHALNLVNTRYVMFGPNAQDVFRNPYALGNAWFVSEIQVTEDAREEMRWINSAVDRLMGEGDSISFDPRTTALVRAGQPHMPAKQRYEVPLGAKITLQEYRSNELTYKVENLDVDAFAVFSETWYPKGWNAYIGDTRQPLIRTDFTLRGMDVPAGTTEIIMRFEPKSYPTGESIALIGSILLILVLLLGVGWLWKGPALFAAIPFIGKKQVA